MSLFHTHLSHHSVRRNIALLLILLFIFPMGVLFGCKQKESASTPSISGEYYFSSYQNNDCEKYVRDADLGDDFQQDSFFDTDGNLYLLAYSKEKSVLVRQENANGSCQSVLLSISARISASTISPTKEIWVLTSYLDESYHIQYDMQSLSTSGEPIRPPVHVPELVDRDIICLRVLDEDRLLVALSDELWILDTQGTHTGTITLDPKRRVEDISVSDDKTIGVISVSLSSEASSTLDLFDDGGKKRKSFSLPQYAEGQRIFGGANGFASSFLLASDCYVGVLDLNSFSFVHWVEKERLNNGPVEEGTLVYNLHGIYHLYAAGMSGDTILYYGITREIKDHITGLFSLSFLPYTSSRTSVSIGILLDQTPGYLRDVIDYYNRMQDQVYIEMHDYRDSFDPQLSDADNWRRCVTSILTEFVNHTGPDLYLVEPSVLMDLQKQGALWDLTTYLDQVDQDDFLPGALTLFNEGFNKQFHQEGTYFVSPFFTIQGMAYNLEIGKEITEKQYTYADLIQQGERNNSYITGTNEMAYNLFSLPICELLSQEDSFDTQKASAVIDELNQLFGASVLFNQHKASLSKLNVDSPLFRPVVIGSFDDYIQAMTSFEGGGTIKNYPCTVNTCGISISECYCISNQSDHKQEAWDFLYFLLQPHTQVQIASAGHIPVSREAFEKDIDDCMVNSISYYASADADSRDFFGYPAYKIDDPDACQSEYRNLVTTLLSDSPSLLYYDEVILLSCREAVLQVTSGEKTSEQATDSLYQFVKLYRQESES